VPRWATDDPVLRMWDSPAAREKIDEYVKATLRRSRKAGTAKAGQL
jgi:hypothetical protein